MGKMLIGAGARGGYQWDMTVTVAVTVTPTTVTVTGTMTLRSNDDSGGDE